MTLSDLCWQALCWGAIAHDGALKCRCGEHPYTDGNECPKCFAYVRLELLEEQMRKTKRGRSLLERYAEPKRLARCRTLARKRILKLVPMWKEGKP